MVVERTTTLLMVLAVLTVALEFCCSPERPSTTQIAPSGPAPGTRRDLAHCLRASPAPRPLVTSSSIPLIPGISFQAGAPVGTPVMAPRFLGELALLRLSSVATVEDAWVYLDSYELWIDVGDTEAGDTVRTDLTPVVELIKPEQERPKQICLYHIHPASSHTGDALAPPSAADVRSLAWLDSALKRDFGVKLTGCVLSDSGRWTYEVTSELERWLGLADTFGGSDEASTVQVSHARGSGTGFSHRVMRNIDFIKSFESLLARTVFNTTLTTRQRIDTYRRDASMIGVCVTYRSW